jgi:hypothetical protein
MRPDMDKVLVEAPRSGRAYARCVAGSRRRERQRLDRDGEGGPLRVGMKQGGGDKHFGEHLGPLYRWLRAQVNRPWRQVLGELCAALDRRNVVQAHLFQHLGDRVDVDTSWEGGCVWVRGWRGLQPLAEGHRELYVHPRTGLLLVNRERLRARRERRQVQAAALHAAQQDRFTVGLPPGTRWHRIEGRWYELQLRPLPPDGSLVWDVLLARAVGRDNRALLAQHHGSGSVFAWHKRQLDGRSLQRRGLANEDPGDD